MPISPPPYPFPTFRNEYFLAHCPVAGKREPEQEAEAQQWIERVVGERFPPVIDHKELRYNRVRNRVWTENDSRWLLRVLAKRQRVSVVRQKTVNDVILRRAYQDYSPRVDLRPRATGVSYEDALRDGVLLCKLMNKLQPGLITKINTSGGDYKMMDNLNQFQKACVKYGVPDVDLFQAVDLIERKNIAQTYRHPEWRGPWLGPKPSEENKRNFTEEQLRAGEGYIGLQAGTNKGATQAGQNFGATRKILLGK
ncbi:Muscle-specific protein 20 [Melipona quadrifasciata]|uniref:Transgelin n=1 Tax=Melipona quadrifasciata TaxID=166423 RepID=A0A0N0BK98_9HYME|nr:Muscle-specific protein 20 [Melipona quadrifasciata]